MKDMSDNEFDRLFKEKSQNFDYEFEEEAWLLMEQKLRKKDRIIFLRDLSIAASFLLFLIAGIFLYNRKQESMLAKKTGAKDTISLASQSHIDNKEHGALNPTDRKPQGHASLNQEVQLSTSLSRYSKSERNSSSGKSLSQQGSLNRNSPGNIRSTGSTPAIIGPDSLSHLDHIAFTVQDDLNDPDLSLTLVEVESSTYLDSNLSEPGSQPGHLLSFTFSAGPDFSSTRSLAGKRGNLSLGLLVNFNLKPFSLSTGVRYGVKKYDAEALDYALRNPARANEIYNIDASCNVLEIPLQLSVPVKSWKNRSIALSGGLSSYLMLKEKYLFEYTPESGTKDFLLEKHNANQTYFGVASFSARYTFKPTNQNIRFGLEPYVKLPLGGVGEGKVKLKSSGISLTMTYGTTKKH